MSQPGAVFPLPLELTGQLVGIEFILISIMLIFRHRYLDGFCYPWQVPWAFFTAGGALVLIVTEIAVSGLLHSFHITLVGYLLLGLIGLISLHYFWFIYPFQHPNPPYNRENGA